MVPSKIKPLVVIVGETAAGKSDLATKLAKKFNGEIINADSWSVYKGFDIGTAKPTVKDQKKIPHHLIDVADPLQGFNAAKYQKMAKEQINKTNQSGRIPFLVGGTGLYIDTIIYDYGFLPGNYPLLRAKYNAMSLDDLLSEVEKHGYDVSGIDLNNKRRVIRLLENNGLRPTKQPLRRNTLIIGLSSNKEQLEARIAKRVDAMIASGLVNEVRSLANRYSWDIEPMKGIGYREFQKYFLGETTIEETRSAIIKDSVDLVKKQNTWFKRNKSIQWVNNGSESVDLVTTFLNNLSDF